MSAPSSFADAGLVEQTLTRLNKLHDKRPRAWGKMSAHEMLCHLADAFAVALGERPATSQQTWMNRTVVKYAALHTSVAWPKSTKTMPEVDQMIGGTKPADFERDRERAIALLRRFVEPGARYGPHPMFGTLTREEWLVWGYRHTDHHLRQFAL
jgi:hypothetical protein